MTKQKIEFNQEYKFKTSKFIYGGACLAHSDELDKTTILFEKVAENEEFIGEIYRKKKGVYWGKVKELIRENAEQRTQPKCKHYHECGGCSFQHIKESEEIKIKEKILQEIFPEVELGESILSPNREKYRNKCEFTFGHDKDGVLVLGLHPPERYFEVLDIQECYLLPDLMWQILQEVKKLASESGLKALNDLTQEGFWSTVTIRQSISENQCFVFFRVKNPLDSTIHQITKNLIEKFPEIIGVGAGYADKKLANEHKNILVYGKEYLEEGDFQYHGESFFQINSYILPIVLKQIAELVEELEPEILFDLFCGMGILGIYAGKHLQNIIPPVKGARGFIAAEADELGCILARKNAEINNLNNYECKHMNLYKGGWGNEFIQYKNQQSCLIIDPPRAGLTKKTIKQILKFMPSRIIYMSCNPTTQKRDIDLLIDGLEESDINLSATSLGTAQARGDKNYKISNLQMIDMFPQTFHIESLSVLDRLFAV